MPAIAPNHGKCSPEQLQLTAGPAACAAPPLAPPPLQPSSGWRPPRPPCPGRAAGAGDGQRQGRGRGPGPEAIQSPGRWRPGVQFIAGLPTSSSTRPAAVSSTRCSESASAAVAHHLHIAGHVGMLAVAPAVQPLCFHCLIHLLPANGKRTGQAALGNGSHLSVPGGAAGPSRTSATSRPVLPTTAGCCKLHQPPVQPCPAHLRRCVLPWRVALTFWPRSAALALAAWMPARSPYLQQWWCRAAFSSVEGPYHKQRSQECSRCACCFVRRKQLSGGPARAFGLLSLSSLTCGVRWPHNPARGT